MNKEPEARPGSVLDYVRYDPPPADKVTMKDHFLNDAINTIFMKEWTELYGMNLKETLELEYSVYQHMKKRLDIYREQSKHVKDQLLKDKEQELQKDKK